MGMPGLDIFQCMDLLADAGFDGIEARVARDGQLNDAEFDEEFCRKVKEHAERRNLEICCLTPYYRDFLSEERREEEIAGLKRVVDMAALLHCPLVRSYGGPEIPEGMDEEEARESIAEGLRRVARHAQDRGVGIAIETHSGTSTYSATEAHDMLRRIDHPNAGVLLDYSWVLRGGKESIDEIFSMLGSRIVHCHVKDYAGPAPDGDFHRQLLVGEGGLPWKEVIAKLVEVGYDRYLCDEYEKYWKKELPEPEDWFPKNLDAMRRIVDEARRR